MGVLQSTNLINLDNLGEGGRAAKRTLPAGGRNVGGTFKETF